MINVQLLFIRETTDLDGALAQKDFTFEFPDGSTATVGLEKDSIDLPEEEQKQVAVKKAWADIQGSLKLTQTRILNETVNLDEAPTELKGVLSANLSTR
jgi:hypothetical protein